MSAHHTCLPERVKTRAHTNMYMIVYVFEELIFIIRLVKLHKVKLKGLSLLIFVSHMDNSHPLIFQRVVAA